MRVLRHELRNEGCTAEVIEQALDELRDEVDEDAMAMAALRRGARTRQGDLARLFAYMARRGFDRSTVERGLRVLQSDGPRDESAREPMQEEDAGSP